MKYPPLLSLGLSFLMEMSALLQNGQGSSLVVLLMMMLRIRMRKARMEPGLGWCSGDFSQLARFAVVRGHDQPHG